MSLVIRFPRVRNHREVFRDIGESKEEDPRTGKRQRDAGKRWSGALDIAARENPIAIELSVRE